jgi:hypothetical protein
MQGTFKIYDRQPRCPVLSVCSIWLSCFVSGTDRFATIYRHKFQPALPCTVRRRRSACVGLIANAFGNDRV